MSTRTIKIASPLQKAALVLAAVACIAGAYFFAKWGLVNSAVLRVDNLDLALYLTTLAPDDPLPHYATAVFLDRSFEPADAERSLKEFELAAGLAPDNPGRRASRPAALWDSVLGRDGPVLVSSCESIGREPA